MDYKEDMKLLDIPDPDKWGVVWCLVIGVGTCVVVNIYARYLAYSG